MRFLITRAHLVKSGIREEVIDAQRQIGAGEFVNLKVVGHPYTKKNPTQRTLISATTI